MQPKKQKQSIKPKPSVAQCHLPPACISLTVHYLEHFPILLWSHLHWTNSSLPHLIKYTCASRLPATWGFQCIVSTLLSTHKLLHRPCFLKKKRKTEENRPILKTSNVSHSENVSDQFSLDKDPPPIKVMTHMQKCVKWIWNEMNLSKFQEIVKDRGAWSAAIHGVAVRHDWATEQQQICKSRGASCRLPTRAVPLLRVLKPNQWNLFYLNMLNCIIVPLVFKCYV